MTVLPRNELRETLPTAAITQTRKFITPSDKTNVMVATSFQDNRVDTMVLS